MLFSVYTFKIKSKKKKIFFVFNILGWFPVLVVVYCSLKCLKPVITGLGNSYMKKLGVTETCISVHCRFPSREKHSCTGIKLSRWVYLSLHPRKMSAVHWDCHTKSRTGPSSCWLKHPRKPPAPALNGWLMRIPRDSVRCKQSARLFPHCASSLAFPWWLEMLGSVYIISQMFLKEPVRYTKVWQLADYCIVTH